jgi:octaprenyl-diphosphate synthase
MRNGDPGQAGLIRKAIEQGGLEEFAPVLQAIHETGALQYARNQAELEAQAACAAIDHLPGSNYKDSLLQLADFAVTRRY